MTPRNSSFETMNAALTVYPRCLFTAPEKSADSQAPETARRPERCPPAATAPRKLFPLCFPSWLATIPNPPLAHPLFPHTVPTTVPTGHCRLRTCTSLQASLMTAYCRRFRTNPSTSLRTLTGDCPIFCIRAWVRSTVAGAVSGCGTSSTRGT